MKRSSNRYLDRIRCLTGETDPGTAAAVFVRSIRADSESLESLAHRLGISKIIEEHLPFEGGLFEIGQGELVIKLNVESSFVRKRFTLAHELGHMLLNTVPAFRKAASHGDEALERACDMIAAELLMPTTDATAFVRGLGQPSPEKLTIIASKYRVSLYAAAIRVQSGLNLWKCSIGCWERQPQIKTVWFVGRRLWDRTDPDSYSLDLALSSEGPVQSKEVWQRGTNGEPVWLNLLRLHDGRVLGLVGFVN